MSAIRVRVDQDDIKRVQRALWGIRKGSDKALKNAINRTLTQTKKFMVNETYNVLNVKKRRIRKSLKKPRRATQTRLSGSVRSVGRPLNLIEFAAKQNKKGVSVKIWRNQGRETIKHAFIFQIENTDKQGNKNLQKLVGWRAKKPSKKGYGGDPSKIFTTKQKKWMSYGALPPKYRFPIHSLTGPRIQDIMDRRDVITKIENKSGIQLKKELNYQVEQLLRKYG